MITLDGNSLTVQTLIEAARHGVAVRAAERALARVEAAHQFVHTLIADPQRSAYGINTGLGSLYREHLSPDDLVRFSRNVVLSHACGVGKPFPGEVTRGAMILLANNLLSGHSGVRPIIPQTIIEMLNRGVLPVVPSQGSLGASGDLAPLAHIALVFTRDPDRDSDQSSGKAIFQDEAVSGYRAMQNAGIERVVLGAKEALAVINGTHFITSLLALSVWDASILLRTVDVIAAMTVEAMRGLSSAFDERVHLLRPHEGQLASAANIRAIYAGSRLIDTSTNVVQDPYALRCTPQVHGGARDTLRYAERVLSVELNAVTDNPLIFVNEDGTGEVVSGGNFHGEPLGYAADSLGVALAGLGTLAERRAYRLLDSALNRGLPSFLVDKPGLSTGLMIAQYTAASLASENKVLSHPSTVDSITSSENQEDHVSMATFAARKLRTILENVTRICAIELLVAAQALDFRKREGGAEHVLGNGTYAAWALLRSRVPFLAADRELAEEIEQAADLIRTGALLRTVEKAIGEPIR